MRIHRFFGIFDFSKRELAISDVDLLHQWRNVLRLKVESQVLLVNADSQTATAKIKTLNTDEAIVEIIDIAKSETNSRKVVLYAAIIKKQNFELVVQKATEIGISEIVPVIAKRTVKTGLDIGRLEKISKEAVEQAERETLPLISEPVYFEEAVKMASSNENNLFFDRRGKKIDRNLIAQKNIGLFIGPEGGWDESERELAKKSGMIIAGLGANNLRAETAAIVASWLVCN